MKIRVAFLAGSPVYYQAPLYRRLAADPRLDFTAIFASSAGATRPRDGGYGRLVDWRVDALGGYRSVFLRRAEQNPSGGGIFALRDLDVVSQLVPGRYDVLIVHGYHTITHIAASLTQRALGGARLFREEQTLLSRRSPWKTALKRLGLPAYFRGSYGLFIGTENRRWFLHWGFPERRLFHTPYSVDNDALRSAAHDLLPERDRLRSEFGFSDQAVPVILTVCRLIPRKQVLHLLEAFAEVRAERRCGLLIVGSGQLERELRRRIAAEQIPDVVLAGFLDQTQVPRAYAAADIFALVSSRDPWGLVVNEAMNFGLPIVSSDKVGSAADLVESSRNGYVVPSGDRDALASALRTLVDSRELRQRYGRASLEIIQPWHYDRVAAGVCEAVAAAVGADRWNMAMEHVAESLEAPAT